LRFSSHQFIITAHIGGIAYEALLNLDAILRTNWRMLFSHKNYCNGTHQ